MDACKKSCANDFVVCMQMALDTFAMGACYDAQMFCERRCPIEDDRNKLDFDPSLADQLTTLP